MHPDRRLNVNFGNDFSAETIDVIGQFTSWQVRFEKINRDEPMASKDEVILLQNFSQAILIQNMPKLSSDNIRKEIKHKLANCTNFLLMLQIIQKILLQKLRCLREGEEILPRSFQLTKSSSQNEGQEKEAKTTKKWSEGDTKSNKRKHDNAGDYFTKSRGERPSGVAAKCKGCGWDLKPDKKKGDPGPPPKYVCPRIDMRGCQSDKRRNSSSSN